MSSLALTRNGKEVPILLSGSVLKDTANKPIGFVGVIKNITWQKKEIDNILGQSESDIFCDIYDISLSGNWDGKNILHISDRILWKIIAI